jgi:hypothetical protein
MSRKSGVFENKKTDIIIGRFFRPVFAFALLFISTSSWAVTSACDSACGTPQVIYSTWSKGAKDQSLWLMPKKRSANLIIRPG